MTKSVVHSIPFFESLICTLIVVLLWVAFSLLNSFNLILKTNPRVQSYFRITSS